MVQVCLALRAALTVDTCGSSFDTALTVYTGDSCPVDNARQIACNDNTCGTNASASFNAAAGATYLIRVFGLNGHNPTSGHGVLNLAMNCCRADFNQMGGLSVQDIFDFLGAYFSGDLAADFNGVGGLSVQDIFDFLEAYFTGCP